MPASIINAKFFTMINWAKGDNQEFGLRAVAADCFHVGAAAVVHSTVERKQGTAT